MSVDARAAQIRLLLFDVDGVMTDGTILLGAHGEESKVFHIRDGTAVVLAHKAGLMTGLLSARQSASTSERATQLGIKLVYQGVTSKLTTYERILREHRLTDEQVAYMGDDLVDLPVLDRVGLSAAPADAVPDVRERVDWVSSQDGGRGAVRDFVELVLRAQSRWEGLLAPFISTTSPEHG